MLRQAICVLRQAITPISMTHTNSKASGDMSGRINGRPITNRLPQMSPIIALFRSTPPAIPSTSLEEPDSRRSQVSIPQVTMKTLTPGDGITTCIDC